MKLFAPSKTLALALAVIAMLCLGLKGFRLVLVIGDSMRPSLQTGDLLLIDKNAYRSLPPKRGEIVVAEHGNDLIVKRVVGLPGEEVALKRGRVYINGSPVVEPYPIESGPLDVLPGTLFAGRFALLGDNRALSPSEIVHAVVARPLILGKVVWSLHLPRTDRTSG